jgi:uncharacterized membrane protein YbaN (DUF454 family)
MPDRMKKRLLIVAGTLSTAIGIIGIIVPILPTTPFLLLAAACYLRSSERFYRWLLNNRLFGTYIGDYLAGRGMPLKTKVFTLLLLWIAIGISVCAGTQDLVVRIVLGLVAVGVTLHIILIKVKKQ